MIERSERDGIAVISLTHGKANTMDLELCQTMIDAFDELSSSSAKAVVLTGQGRIFSAGVDLLRTHAGGPTYVRQFLPLLNKMFAAVFQFPRPVVAAINGHAIAGGCVLACCADYRLMAQGDGRIGVTELLVGLPFPALAFEVMRLTTTPRFLAQAIYRGGTCSPDEALACGWVHEVVAPSLLMEEAFKVAAHLAGLPPNTFVATKRQLHMPAIERLERDGDRIDAAVTDVWAAPEASARIRAYVERTLKKR
ncbi:MAG TPA: enoyl-CoA hydratase/isomerase family protein [Xanthobacteraceae bacterium]|nr:enoyl-CoA hydratase/isomerase family protein [Xanthobacteraceae bacterium]